METLNTYIKSEIDFEYWREMVDLATHKNVEIDSDEFTHTLKAYMEI